MATDSKKESSNLKLKTRIILMCIIAIVTSVLVIDCVIINIYKKNSIDIAKELSEKEFQGICLEYNNAFYQAQIPENEEIFAINYFKKKRDDLVIYVKGDFGESIFNHTVFSPQDLQGFYQGDEKCVQIDWGGKNLLVFRSDIRGNILYKIFDISYIGNSLKSMIVTMIFVSVIVTAVMIFVVAILLRRAFLPMKEIMVTSADMVAGNYDRRIVVNKNDEIGVVAQGFNEMAQAVEIRIKKLEEEQLKKNMFMGNLAHEMKTPLSAIYGYAQTLQSIKMSREDEEKAFRYIEDESLRLSHLFEKLMKLILINEDETIHKEEIRIEDLFHKAVNTCHKKIEAKDIKVEIGVASQSVMADRELLLDVVINLLDNAINASKEQGVIKLYTRESDGLELVVEDFGKGIAVDEVERIMEPFYMVDKSRARRSGGAGLGLALVEIILDKHDMKLLVESEEGVGTRMIVLGNGEIDV